MVAYAEKSFVYYFTAGECWSSLLRFTGMYCIGSPWILKFTELYLLAAAFDSAPVVLIMNQVHMLGRKSDTQEGTTCRFAAVLF